MMNRIKLRNNGSTVDSQVIKVTANLYYPRLQVNKHGEIVLSLYKHGVLTTGLLVGKTPESQSKLSIGQRLDDWEVCGELSDYDGEIQLAISNNVPTVAFDEIIGRGDGGFVTQRRILLQKLADEPLSDSEKKELQRLTDQIDTLSNERNQIVERFSNRQQLSGDKERLQEINSVYW